MTTTLFDLIAGSWLSKSIAVAARLGIADVLGTGPMAADEIAATVGANPDALLRLLRLLASQQVFALDAEGRFLNSPLSEQLRTEHALSLRYFFILSGEEYYDAWGRMMHTMTTGQSAFPAVFGGSIYEHMATHPETARVYDLAMRDLARPVGYLLARQHDFSDAETIVDIGGGAGEVLMQVLAVHVSARGICFDRSDVCARAMDDGRNDPNVCARLEFRPGDFFVEVPAGGNVYLLKNVLHNWNDDACVTILTNIAQVLRATRPAPSGRPPRLLVIEPVVEKDSRSPQHLMNALFQMVICQDGTRERTLALFAALLERAGLRMIDSQALPTGHSVIVCVAIDALSTPAEI